MYRLRQFIQDYAWFILKNVLGWLLLLMALVFGPVVPGPGGIPLFLIGFALVTFPGKRRLTARVLRGRLLPNASHAYRLAAWAIALAGAGLTAWIWVRQHSDFEQRLARQWSPAITFAIAYAIHALLLLGILRLSVPAINLILRVMPSLRRKVRPALRRHGIRLLPPRWYRHHHPLPHPSTGPFERIRRHSEEVVHFGEQWSAAMHRFWNKLRPRLPKLIGLIVVPLVFWRLIQPIWDKRSEILPYLADIRWELLLLAILMFAANQFFCRLLSWRGVLKGLGHRLPFPASARIWASSELARYIPGVVWQVVGRAYLARPYGIPATTCSVSQILEITLYLLANITTAVLTLSFVGGRISDDVRPFLRAATILLPILLGFLHPRIFYPTVNFILRKIGKSVIEQRLSGRRLVGLLLLGITGQFWLGLAIWVATWSILHVRLEHAWLLAGAYCLAWTAGFCLAAMAPSGLGFRELVLGGTLFLVLPPDLKLDKTAAIALFSAIALLLRLWATAGELLFAAFAYLWNFRSLPPAPGDTLTPAAGTHES